MGKVIGRNTTEDVAYNENPLQKFQNIAGVII